jgi:DNA-3-methyladenine glycosylase
MKLSSILKLSPDLASPLLLGAQFTTTIDGKKTGGIIVEVEAYLPDDPASHSFIGQTKRNQSMFKEAGTFYVYTLRHHSLANLVTEGIGRPGAILIRALMPNTGIEIMQDRRGVFDIYRLCKGPGNLAKALSISKEHDGLNIFAPHSLVEVLPLTKPLPVQDIALSPRIGISKNARAPLRFFIKNSKFVSR